MSVFQFSTLYLECLCHALYLISSYREDARTASIKICEVLTSYQKKCLQERLDHTYRHVNPGGPRPKLDAECEELIRKMQKEMPISNNLRYATSFGDKWPSITSSSGLTTWDKYVVGHRCREGNLVFAMQQFLQYRRATRQLYASKFDEVINTASQLRTSL